MGLIDLPVELLIPIIDYAIPKNWKYYLEGQRVLSLRLICSKPFTLSYFSRFIAEFFCLF